MARIDIDKTTFAAGEIAPDLLGRGDLRVYANGASELRNVFVQATGGVVRRPGLRYVATAAGAGRLIAFEFNTEQVYLLAVSDGGLDIYRNDAKVATLVTPWTAAQIGQLSWVQSADTLFVTHPDVPPQKITRTSHADWTIAPWAFLDQDGRIQQPHHKFANNDVTLAASGTTGTVSLTASADVFDALHVGTRVRLQNKEVEITAVASATSATATVKETLAGTAATQDWEEQAFSAVHGWPTAACFHQDRLVIGGARDLPNRLWLSKSADLFNFDLGEGLDDAAIEFAILSDQVNAIRAVFSGRHLQIFTSGAEWMVTGEPLTPANLQLKRQTRIGSPIDRTVPPRSIDGATVFCGRDDGGVREFLFADVEQAYQSTDLATMSSHLMATPLDQDYDTAGRRLHVIMADGSLATLTVYRAENVNAWSRQDTDGAFTSVAVVGPTVYVLVRRGAATLIEKFDTAFATDSAVSAAADPATATWSGLGHLDGRTVAVVADGAPVGNATVSGGSVDLVYAAATVEVGLPYTHRIAPMPPILASGKSGMGVKVRPVSLTLRLRETPAVRLDVGRGYIDLPFRTLGEGLLDAPPVPFTGDKTVRALGWRTIGPTPMWSIVQETPLPFNLLSVVLRLAANG